MKGFGREDVKRLIVVSCSEPLLASGLVWVPFVLEGEGSNSASGGDWISIDQALAMVSISKSSLRTRILPHESQLVGMRILSRSMALCLTVSLFRSEWMPRLLWMSVRTLLESKEGV